MRGRTAAQIAASVEVSPQVMSRWRAGRALPRAEQLDKLAEVLGVDVEVFFSRSGLSSDSTPQTMLQRLAEFYGARILWPKGES
jgi:transcriptional regulator with XRE-family HTH domain